MFVRVPFHTEYKEEYVVHNDTLHYDDTLTILDWMPEHGYGWARGDNMPWRVLIHTVALRAAGIKSIPQPGARFKVEVMRRPKRAQAFRITNYDPGMSAT